MALLAPAARPIVLSPGVAPPPATSSALPTPIPPSVWSLSPADPALAATVSLSSSSVTLVASRAARLAEYDVILALAHSRLLPHPPPGLLSSLSEAGRPDLVCAVLRQAADLRSSELLPALRCFLSPASDDAYDAMVGVKNSWRDAAVLAVQKCGEKGAGEKVNASAKRAALLLVMGHDGFTSPEVCLHYLFASGDVDSVVLGAAVAELDGEEVVRLMRYLTRWIGKYQRFPEAQAFRGAAGMLRFEQCDSVPSFRAVTRALGLVLDEHFSHLVLNSEVREDLRAAQVMVRELAAEAESSGPILDLLLRLHQDV